MITKRFFVLCSVALVSLFYGVQLTRAGSSIAGAYRCWSYNVGGAGKSCTSPPLVLNEDGTYSMSSEEGTYTVNGDQVRLSKSKIRGPGRLMGNRIVFEYEYRGLQHTVTYLRQGEAKAERITTRGSSASSLERVDLTVVFPPQEKGLAGWVNTVALVREGEDTAAHDKLAVYDGKQAVRVTFWGVQRGSYRVVASSGFEKYDVGRIDLRNVSEPVKLTIDAVLKETKRGKEPPENKDAPPCNPNLPHYVQKGCREQ